MSMKLLALSLRSTFLLANVSLIIRSIPDSTLSRLTHSISAHYNKCFHARRNGWRHNTTKLNVRPEYNSCAYSIDASASDILFRDRGLPDTSIAMENIYWTCRYTVSYHSTDLKYTPPLSFANRMRRIEQRKSFIVRIKTLAFKTNWPCWGSNTSCSRQNPWFYVLGYSDTKMRDGRLRKHVWWDMAAYGCVVTHKSA